MWLDFFFLFCKDLDCLPWKTLHMLRWFLNRAQHGNSYIFSCKCGKFLKFCKILLNLWGIAPVWSWLYFGATILCFFLINISVVILFTYNYILWDTFFFFLPAAWRRVLVFENPNSEYATVFHISVPWFDFWILCLASECFPFSK